MIDPIETAGRVRTMGLASRLPEVQGLDTLLRSRTPGVAAELSTAAPADSTAGRDRNDG